MPEAARSRAGSGRPLPRVRRRLAQLLAARLVLAAVVLAAALTLIGVGDEGEGSAEPGLYATVAAAFLASALFAALLAATRGGGRLGAAQLAADVGLVTALVHFSGGSESIFAFLYLPITVYAALLFGRPGAYGGSTLSALAFGALLLARHHGWLTTHGAPAPPGPVQLLLWGSNAGALLLVALLASMLARELDRAGRALHERTRDLRSLRWLHERTVESLTSGLVTVDTFGRITSFNPEAVRITGWASAEALGRPLERVIPGALDSVCATLDARDRHGRLRTRLRVRRQSGEEQHLGLSGSVLRHEDGTPSGHVVIFQDVTRVVEMERELRRRERLAVAGRLAASLAHEIRNPLAGMEVLAGLLRRRLHQRPEERELVEELHGELRRLAATVTASLDFVRPVALRREPVDAVKLLEEALEQARARVPFLGSVERDYAQALPPVEADPEALRAVFTNLIANALEAMGAEPEAGPGCLRLGLRAVVSDRPARPLRVEGGRVPTAAPPTATRELVASVADSGPGVPAGLRERIFYPFFTTKPRGCGIGLASVQKIVAGHGGRLELDASEARGAVFRVRLPLDAEAGR